MKYLNNKNIKLKNLHKSSLRIVVVDNVPWIFSKLLFYFINYTLDCEEGKRVDSMYTLLLLLIEFNIKKWNNKIFFIY